MTKGGTCDPGCTFKHGYKPADIHSGFFSTYLSHLLNLIYIYIYMDVHLN